MITMDKLMTGLLKGRRAHWSLFGTVLAAAGLSLVITQAAWTNSHHTPNKLEGAWINKVPGYPVQWVSVLSPCDASGHSAAMSGTVQVRVPIELMYPALFPDIWDTSLSQAFVGDMVMTGPNKAKFTMVGHGVKQVVPTLEYPFTEQVVLIWVASGEAKFKGASKLESTGSMAFYLPEADSDGDGLPDEGATPVVCMPISGISTRLGQASPCTPPTP